MTHSAWLSTGPQRRPDIDTWPAAAGRSRHAVRVVGHVNEQAPDTDGGDTVRDPSCPFLSLAGGGGGGGVCVGVGVFFGGSC